MASINQIIKGLEIISKYSDPEAHDICAEHDCIYAGPSIKVSEEDENVLDGLGWHWDKDAGSWARFV